MSHGDSINCLPDGLTKLVIMRTHHAAISNDKKKLLAQFHPEVIHSEFGMTVIKNFVIKFSVQLIGQQKLLRRQFQG